MSPIPLKTKKPKFYGFLHFFILLCNTKYFMQNPKDAINTLHDIKNIMEKSTKFNALSGFSFISVGCIALVSAIISAQTLNNNIFETNLYQPISLSQKNHLVIIGFSTLFLAILAAFYFTHKKAVKNKVSLTLGGGPALSLHFVTPLLVGGIVALALLYYQHLVFVAPLLLVFYGLSVVSGSKFTHPELIYLGFIQLALGCLGLFYLGHGLILWTLGFGVAHIIWGIYYYLKHE